MLSSAENSEEEGLVESGILPDPVTEEKFSVDDFDDVSLEENELVEKPSPSHLDTKKSETSSTSTKSASSHFLKLMNSYGCSALRMASMARLLARSFDGDMRF